MISPTLQQKDGAQKKNLTRRSPGVVVFFLFFFLQLLLVISSQATIKKWMTLPDFLTDLFLSL